jgi:hypothetical protein
MAALGRIEKICDRAENDHDAGAEKRKNQDQDDGENGQDQGVLDQGLPFLTGKASSQKSWKLFNDESHLRELAGNHFKNLQQRNSFDNARDGVMGANR